MNDQHELGGSAPPPPPLDYDRHALAVLNLCMACRERAVLDQWPVIKTLVEQYEREFGPHSRGERATKDQLALVRRALTDVQGALNLEIAERNRQWEKRKALEAEVYRLRQCPSVVHVHNATGQDLRAAMKDWGDDAVGLHIFVGPPGAGEIVAEAVATPPRSVLCPPHAWDYEINLQTSDWARQFDAVARCARCGKGLSRSQAAQAERGR